MKVHSTAATDVGRRRPHNEDVHVCNQKDGIYIVCDGMGGHAAGEVAAALAAEVTVGALTEHRERLNTLLAGDRDQRSEALGIVERAVQDANARVFKQAAETDAQRGMGTTLTLLFLAGARAVIAQVGDSRLYLTRAGQAHQVTTDHTLWAEMVRAGRVKPDDHERERELGALTRAVGVHPNVEVDVFVLDVLPGDVFLLCSDGLHAYLDDFDLPSFFEHSGRGTAATNLVEHANKQGGHDNITAVCLFVPHGDTERTLRVRLTLDTLKSIPLCQYLTYAELLRLIPVCVAVAAEPGEMIVYEGDEGSDLYIVLEGEVAVLAAKQEVARMGAGRYFGEMSLVDSQPRSASVRAVTETHLIRISRDAFYEVLRKDSVMAVKLLWNFIQSLSMTVRQQNRTLGGPTPVGGVQHPYLPEPKGDDHG